MKPAAFDYHRVDRVEDALDRLAELGEDAKVLAGGQSLVAMMNFRLVRPPALVDITRIPDLDYVARDGDVLRIGALTSHREIELLRDPGVIAGYEVLPRAARWVGHYPIRTRGTFGGSIAHADPSAEWCMLALALDATIVATGPEGEREIPAADFFLGFFTTALEAGELVTEVRFPQPRPHAALHEFARRHGDFAIVAAAVAVDVDGDHMHDARIVVGGVDEVPLRVHAAEQALEGAAPGAEAFAEAGRAAAAAVDPSSDVHGSAQYRKDLTDVLVRRALAEAIHADRRGSDARG
ncbi:MAG TPA: xanthine dehydrogenase family protein subunit M [Solirubrobacteraceae bacterium]|nr:xanthine dehydrogenase family protein subunit M [Solirubrobacteraceae bacterium]